MPVQDGIDEKQHLKIMQNKKLWPPKTKGLSCYFIFCVIAIAVYYMRC